MKTVMTLLTVLSMTGAMASTLSMKPELRLDKKEFSDGTVEYHNVRVLVAGRTFYLSTFSDQFGIDTNRNDVSFCKSQGFRKTIGVLNEVDYSSKPFTFSTSGEIDDSIYLHPEGNSHRFSKVVCANKINPQLETNN